MHLLGTQTCYGTRDTIQQEINESINISSLRTLSKNLVISARNEIRRTKLSEESRGMEGSREAVARLTKPWSIHILGSIRIPSVKGVSRTSEMAHNHLGFPVQSDYVTPSKMPLSALCIKLSMLILLWHDKWRLPLTKNKVPLNKTPFGLGSVFCQSDSKKKILHMYANNPEEKVLTNTPAFFEWKKWKREAECHPNWTVKRPIKYCNGSKSWLEKGE